MKISVIIPTANDDLRLRWALEGVARQSHRDAEVIVVNDGGHPATVETARAFVGRLPVKYLYLDPPSESFRAAAARNLGARHSSGDLLFFLDGDCILRPDVLALHAQCFEPGVAHGSQRRRVHETCVHDLGTRLDYSWLHANSYPDTWSRLNIGMKLLCSFALSVPAEAFCEIGGFDERHVGWGGEDAKLGRDLQRAGLELRDLGALAVAYHLEHPPRTEQRAPPYFQDPASPLPNNGGPLERLADAAARLLPQVLAGDAPSACSARP